MEEIPIAKTAHCETSPRLIDTVADIADGVQQNIIAQEKVAACLLKRKSNKPRPA